MGSYSFVGQGTGQWFIEILMFGQGAGMGLTMAPATNAIMSAVPREKAGAGSAVNNTVRQVAGALGVAILGSILAVVYRGQLGASTPATVAGRLDQPAAVVSGLPRSAQVKPLVRKDTSESIGASLEFAGRAATALQARAKVAGTALSPAQLAAARTADQKVVGAFLQDSKNSFVSAMHVASIVAGFTAWLGAAVAFSFLPGRRRDAPTARHRKAADAELAHA
jgi:MFS family permease